MADLKARELLAISEMSIGGFMVAERTDKSSIWL